MLLLNKHDTLRAPVVEEGLCLLQTCGRRLRCGNHLCPAACHSGPCLPCPLSVTVSCACGRTAYMLPCGTEATAKPPVCHQVRVSCDFSTMNLVAEGCADRPGIALVCLHPVLLLCAGMSCASDLPACCAAASAWMSLWRLPSLRPSLRHKPGKRSAVLRGCMSPKVVFRQRLEF